MFTKINTAKIITNGTIEVEILKVQKEGTKKIFFSPEFQGKKISRTMFARLNEATALAKLFASRYEMVNNKIQLYK